jgi:hypothetical protein
MTLKIGLPAAVFLSGLVVGTLGMAPPVKAQAQAQNIIRAHPEAFKESSSDYLRSIVGLRLAPVALEIGHRDPMLVGLGSYLVNQVGGCNDCHTSPSFAAGHNPYLGQPKQINTEAYLAGGHPFPADSGETVIPPNITPDEKGRPAGLNFRQFELAMRYGRDPGHPRRILQVMPWPNFQDLTDRDLQAIYLYLSSIPSIPGGPQ